MPLDQFQSMFESRNGMKFDPVEYGFDSIDDLFREIHRRQICNVGDGREKNVYISLINPDNLPEKKTKEPEAGLKPNADESNDLIELENDKEEDVSLKIFSNKINSLFSFSSFFKMVFSI
jgi:hypothetical protein